MSTINKLLIDYFPGQTRFALLSDEKIIEILFDSPLLPSVGSVYIGKVIKNLKDTNGVFLDLGFGKPGFLSNAKKNLIEGQFVTVKIVQPPRKEKGAKLSLVELSNDFIEEYNPSEKKLPYRISRDNTSISWCYENYKNTIEEIIVYSYKPISKVTKHFPKSFKELIISSKDDIFFNYGVDEKIETMLSPVVPLIGGAKIIIDEAEAFTAIDIDSGGLSARETNFIALEKIASELRLRSIGGSVIIDIIPGNDHKELSDHFSKFIRFDPVQTKINGFTPGGKFEINRRRLRPSISEALFLNNNENFFLPKTVALDSLRKCIKYSVLNNTIDVCIYAHKEVVQMLNNELKFAVDQAESIMKGKIRLKKWDKIDISEFSIVSD